MRLDNKHTLSLMELIYWVKKELLSNEVQENDPAPLFVIDEVTVEVNFVISGEGEGGFDLQIVKAGAKVGEERVQKATVRMKPLFSLSELRNKLEEEHPDQLEVIKEKGVRILLKGFNTTEIDVPERES